MLHAFLIVGVCELFADRNCDERFAAQSKIGKLRLDTQFYVHGQVLSSQFDLVEHSPRCKVQCAMFSKWDFNIDFHASFGS
jgi:hypothetical protein